MLLEIATSMPRLFEKDSETDLLGYMAMRDQDPRGARAAFDEFYCRHVKDLYTRLRHNRAVNAVARSDVEVADFIQETFLRAFHHADTFDADGVTDPTRLHRRVQAWLGSIAENLVRDLCRTEHPELHVVDLEAFAEPANQPTEDSEEVKAMRDALDALPEREKDVILESMLHYKFNVTQQRLTNAASAALAKRWGTTPENIRAIRSRTMRALKKAHEARFANPHE